MRPTALWIQRYTAGFSTGEFLSLDWVFNALMSASFTITWCQFRMTITFCALLVEERLAVKICSLWLENFDAKNLINQFIDALKLISLGLSGDYHSEGYDLRMLSAAISHENARG